MIRTVLIIEAAARTLSQGAPLIRYRQNRKTMLEQPDHHAHIASFFGIRCVVAELNKMDHVDYCEDFFLYLQRDFLSSPSDVSVEQTNHLSRSWQQLNDDMTLYLVASVGTGLRCESPTTCRCICNVVRRPLSRALYRLRRRRRHTIVCCPQLGSSIDRARPAYAAPRAMLSDSLSCLGFDNFSWTRWPWR